MKSKKGMIAQLIGAFVIIIVIASIFPIIFTTMTTTYNVSNRDLTSDSQWTTTILNLVPGFFALGILAVITGVAYSLLKPAGLGGYEKSYKKTDEEKMIDELKKGSENDEDEEERIIQPTKNEMKKYIKMDRVIDKLPELTDKNLNERSRSFDKTKYD